MKKYWRFLSLVMILILVLATTLSTGAASAQTVCSPATTLSVPFVTDTMGTFCWHTTTLCYQVNSWHTNDLSINGTSYKNMFVLSSSILPLNGGYTITFDGGSIPYAPGHIEITGPYQAGGTGPAGTGPCDSVPATVTPAGPTATRTRTPTNGPTSTRTRTATAGPSLTRTRTATTGPTITLTPTPTLTSTSVPYYVNIALASSFPQVYIGGANIMATVSTNITNATFTLIVIDTATGLEQSLANPILLPARPASQTANVALGNLANFTLNGARPGTFFFRASVSGEMCTPVCAQGTMTAQSANVSVVGGATPTRTPTPTATATQPNGPCSPITGTAVSPFTQDGIGTFCWQVSNIDSYINSFNTASITVNGTNYTNMFAAVGGLPAKVNGFWYIHYVGSVAWAHFEFH